MGGGRFREDWWGQRGRGEDPDVGGGRAGEVQGGGGEVSEAADGGFGGLCVTWNLPIRSGAKGTACGRSRFLF